MITEWIININLAWVWLALAGAALVVWQLWRGILKSRDRKQRAFQRKLETVLLPRETVTVLCPQGKTRYILTSKRLLTETKEGFTALDLKDIRSAHGTNEAGNRTTVPEKMTVFTIKGPTEITLRNTGEEFQLLAKELAAFLKKRREKEKKKK